MLRRLIVVIALVHTWASVGAAQLPRPAPRAGYLLHDERTLGPFTVQRWVSSTEPNVSPAGMCDCITVVYAGDRLVLTLGDGDGLSAISVGDPSGRDLNRDGLPDLVVSEWSGGAHCCFTTTVYSVGSEVRTILSLSSGNCGAGEFRDLDGDGTWEFLTCDDQWAYAYCSFAESPFPIVVMTYDPTRREYVPATPRFATYLRGDTNAILEEARRELTPGKPPDLDRCTVLGPALALIYEGRLDAGVAFIRELYRRPDREAFEQETLHRVRSSPLWVEQ